MRRICCIAVGLVFSIESPLALTEETSSVPGPDSGDDTYVVDGRDPYFEKQSSLNVGAKGEEHIDVSAAGACQAFHHAELVWLERRFADAQFVQIPQHACTHCEPLIVRWYHEPTGRAHFQVRVYRTGCGDGDGTRKNSPAS